jgi:hypothetical protein
MDHFVTPLPLFRGRPLLDPTPRVDPAARGTPRRDPAPTALGVRMVPKRGLLAAWAGHVAVTRFRSPTSFGAGVRPLSLARAAKSPTARSRQDDVGRRGTPMDRPVLEAREPSDQGLACSGRCLASVPPTPANASGCQAKGHTRCEIDKALIGQFATCAALAAPTGINRPTRAR